MSREILNTLEQTGLHIGTFWNGNSEWVQISFNSSKGYLEMPRDITIVLLKEAVAKLEQQVREDAVTPPWWQEIYKQAKGK